MSEEARPRGEAPVNKGKRRRGPLARAIWGPSALQAKDEGTWPAIMAMISECATDAQLDACAEKLAGMRSTIPPDWEDSIAEVIEKTREEISQEDIGSILRERFDF